MIEVKRELILEEGVPVSVFDRGEWLFDTTALIGKATRQFFNEISLESHRQGQFLPELDIHNGLIIKNNVTLDDYIIIASYPEVIEQQKCATIARMIVCNSKITVKQLVEDADKYGNIKRRFEPVWENVSVYAEPLDSEVKQTDPGKFYMISYKIYAPSMTLSIEDQIELEVNNKKVSFKLNGIDDMTFRDLTLLELSTDMRR